MSQQEWAFVPAFDFPWTVRLSALRRHVLPAAAVASLLAAIGHAAAFPAHRAEWPLAGAFFAGIAIAQALTAALLHRTQRREILVGIAGANMAIIWVYLAAHTVGVPFGPHPWTPEPFGLLDVATAVAEAALITLVLVAASDRALPTGAMTRFPYDRVFAAVAVIAFAAGGSGLTGGIGHTHTGGADSVHEHLPPELHDALALHGDDHERRTHRDHRRSAYEPCTADGDVVIGTVESSDNLVVYSDAGALHAFDPTSNRITQLTARDSCYEHSPQVVAQDTLVFARWEYRPRGTALYEVDLPTGETRLLRRSRAYMSMLGWSPNGTQAAFRRDLRDGTRIDLYDRALDITRPLTLIDAPIHDGYCGGPLDAGIRWSPDGSAIAIVHSDFGDGVHLRVVDTFGATIATREGAVLAQWIDSSRLVYRDLDEPAAWHILDVRDGEVTDLDLTRGTTLAKVSPDGRYIAHGDTWNRELYVAPVERGTEELLGSDVGFPVWLDDTTLLASVIQECEDCIHEKPITGAVAFDVESGSRAELPLASTIGATVWRAPEERADAPGGTTAPNIDAPATVDTYEFTEIDFSVAASDGGGNTVVVKALDLPDGASFDPERGTFRWRPSLGQAGEWDIRFRASDGELRTEHITTVLVRPLFDRILTL